MASKTADSFAAFYDSAVRDVYRYLARGVLGERTTAEDLTQDTFAAVMVAARAGRPEALSMPWVMGVARHKLVDHYRRSQREQRRLMLAWIRDARRDELSDVAPLDPAETQEFLRDLSPEHRLVLILKYCDDLPVDQVAEALGRSVDATNSLLSRARRALARSVEERAS